jgi:Fe2+ transport system protein FeoA
MDTDKINLTQLKNGKDALVTELLAGQGALQMFESLGLVPGARIKKISSAILHGPIIVEKDLTKFAVGYKMSKKIIVEPIEE